MTQPSRAWNLAEESAHWTDQGLWRRLQHLQGHQGPEVQPQDEKIEGLLNFSSNDYLGLAHSDEVQNALKEGVTLHGAGAGASRLVCGSFLAHQQLEQTLAEFKSTEAALVFSSGYAAAMGTLPALLGPGDTVILDKLCHASLVDAARLSGATLRIYPHNHLEKLEKLLHTAKGRVLIVTESVFSMDGDQAPLREIIELKERHPQAWLLLDEAHAVGVLGPEGRGLAAQLGLERKIELQLGTLSKAVGLCGGYLAASHEVINWLINRARSFVYSTAIPPCIAHTATYALKHLITSTEGDKRRKRLSAHREHLASALALRDQSAIFPLIIGDEVAALEASAHLRSAGLWVPAIRYPTVARNRARLRITLSAAHSEQQVQRLLSQILPFSQKNEM